MKAVIDTNVFVSAFLGGRNPNSPHKQILSLAESYNISVYFSDLIAKEYSDVLNRDKFRFSATSVGKLLTLIDVCGVKVNPPVSIVTLPDETDRKFYDAAKFCGVYLITGNTKHYPQGEDFIVTPREFIDLVS